MSEEVLKPTPKTIKRLFAKSGNRCAWKSCLQPIVTQEGTVVGKIAHIEAESEGGPRFNANQSAEDRRAYENLILLCGNHHDVIADVPEAFTVGILRDMKLQHEQSATEVQDAVEVAQAAAQLLSGSVSVSAAGAKNSTVAGVIQNSTINHFVNAQSTAPPAPYRGREPAVGLGRFSRNLDIGKRVGFGFADQGGEPVTFAVSGPCAWFRLWPQAKSARPFTMLALQQASGQGRSLDLVTFEGMADRLVVNADGVGRYQTFDGLQAAAAAFLFRSGELWCVDTNVTRTGFNNHDYVNLSAIRKGLPQMLENYPAILKRLGVPEPYQWQFGLEGIVDFEVAYEASARYSLPRITTGLILVEGVLPVMEGERSPTDKITEEIFAECGEPVPMNLR